MIAFLGSNPSYSTMGSSKGCGPHLQCVLGGLRLPPTPLGFGGCAHPYNRPNRVWGNWKPAWFGSRSNAGSSPVTLTVTDTRSVAKVFS